MTVELPITGRCYCGALSLKLIAHPQTVSYCHCADCRRLSGAPVAAFAAFSRSDIDIQPQWPPGRSHVAGVERWFCPDCGTALAATYDYLPDQIYVPLGVLDHAGKLPPKVHSHTNAALPWLHITDSLPRNAGSSRKDLKAAQEQD